MRWAWLLVFPGFLTGAVAGYTYGHGEPAADEVRQAPAPAAARPSPIRVEPNCVRQPDSLLVHVPVRFSYTAPGEKSVTTGSVLIDIYCKRLEGDPFSCVGVKVDLDGPTLRSNDVNVMEGLRVLRHQGLSSQLAWGSFTYDVRWDTGIVRVGFDGPSLFGTGTNYEPASCAGHLVVLP